MSLQTKCDIVAGKGAGFQNKTAVAEWPLRIHRASLLGSDLEKPSVIGREHRSVVFAKTVVKC